MKRRQITDQMTSTRMRFTDWLITANAPDLKDFQSWVFRSGMRFNSPRKWWGKLGRRDFPHEGVDFCLYRDKFGRVCQLGHQKHIPVIHDGIVRHIFSDYLGQAVVVEHVNRQNETERIISIYAHTTPVENLNTGLPVKRGEIIANIADTRQAKANILPHLHLSVGKMLTVIENRPFTWNDMRNPEIVNLIDPLSLIDGLYRQHVM